MKILLGGPWPPRFPRPCKPLILLLLKFKKGNTEQFVEAICMSVYLFGITEPKHNICQSKLCTFEWT